MQDQLNAQTQAHINEVQRLIHRNFEDEVVQSKWKPGQ